MAKQGDGNDTDLRIRKYVSAPNLSGDNPMTGTYPSDKTPCEDEHGTQTTHITPLVPTLYSDYDWRSFDICENGWNPILVSRLFVRFLKAHFSQVACRNYPETAQYIYNDTAGIGNIRIELATAPTASTEGLMPALLVQRGEQAVERIAIHDVDCGSGPQRPFVRMAKGSFAIHALATSDVFADYLLCEAFDALSFVAPEMRECFQFFEFAPDKVSPVVPLDESGRKFRGTLAVTVGYAYAWKMQPLLDTIAYVTSPLHLQLES